MKTLAGRFAAIRKHLELSQREVADRCGVTKNTWQRYEAGDVPNGSVLQKLAAEGFDTNWILTGEGSMLRAAAPFGATGFGEELPALPVSSRALGDLGYVLVPRYDVRAAAGGGALIEEHNLVKGSVAFRRDWLHSALRANPADLVIVEAVGDSMAGIAGDGDILLVDRSEPKLRGPGTYVFSIEGLLLVKQLRVLVDGALEISGSDPAATPERLSREELDKVNIVGRVIWRAARA